MIDTSKLDTEYLVEFVAGHGEELAKAQTVLIKQLGSTEGGGWTWHGFASCSEAVRVFRSGEEFPQHDNDDVVGAASRTSGVLLYFARKPLDLVVMPDGQTERGSTVAEGFRSRRERRAAARKR